MKRKYCCGRKYGWIAGLFISLISAGTFFCFTPVSVRAANPIVIVIDPGHGGENLGAEYDPYTEKDMTLITARAMKEELEKYEGVIVYLTRDGDQGISIKDRAAFAGEKNADFLFCLHYNSSAQHTLFGAEVWVPASGEFYARGYSFGQIQMKEFTDLGLYSRGIKTRLNDRDENYYGILRYCTSEGIPSVLIEHCHLDHDKDKRFYQQGEEQLMEFGRLDATAVAKYFRLKSEILGVDYSKYPVPETDIPSDIVRPDKTEPELCSVNAEQINEETGQVTVQIKAKDSDSYILYYSYSIDGGNSYMPLEEWPRPNAWNSSSPNHSFTVTVPFDTEIELLAAVCNGFDVWTESAPISIAAIPDPKRLKEELDRQQEQALRQAQAQYEELSFEAENQQEEHSQNVLTIVVIAIVLVSCMVFVSFFLAKTIFVLIKGNKKR